MWFVRIQIRRVIWLISLVILTGCGEVLNEYYISNHLETAVTINMTPFFIETADISSGPLINDLESSVRGELDRPLAYELAGDTIQLTLPPKTTIYLGSSSGGNDLFSELIVSYGERQITMTENDYHDYFDLHDNFVGPIAHVYDIK